MIAAIAFEGSRAATDAYLRYLDGYYVYLLCRPDGAPFYVGKGTKRRALEHELEALRYHPFGETNPIKCNVIRKIVRNGSAVIYRIDSIYPITAQQSCLRREAELIAHFGRLHEGGCLTNLAGGLGNVAGAAPLSLARHSATLAGQPTANPERATLNRFLLGIGPVASVPVKPITQLGRILPTTPHPSPRRPTPRSAYALVASAAAHGLPLSPNVPISRCFAYNGVQAIIENGVARDILKAGMATLLPSSDASSERFALSAAQVQIIVDLVGKQQLIDRGLL